MAGPLLPPLRDVVARYHLMAKKSLGQHFLLDLNLTRRIVDAADDLNGCTVFEIGPGPGGLTHALLASDAKKIIAIEKDPRCVAALQELRETSKGRLEIVEGDALKTDLTKLAPKPRAIVANLPYNIATPLLLGWLEQIDAYRGLTLMFQAEVVDRIVAKPGTKAYGRLSVIAHHCCNVKRVLNISARAFTPPPKVDSAVARFVPRANRPKNIPFESLETVTAAAFGQRRKMLRASLRALGGEELLVKAKIDPQRRAETLTLEEFENLARFHATSESKRKR